MSVPIRLGVIVFFCCLASLSAIAQEKTESEAEKSAPPAAEEVLAAPQTVNVTPDVEDSEISERLTRILIATDWYVSPEVRVEEGVAFLTGGTKDEKYRVWAGDLARSTQDVVAVVNRIQVQVPTIWDFSDSIQSLRSMARRTVQSLPLILFAGIILIATILGMSLIGKLADYTVLKRFENNLLRGVVRKGLLLVVLLFGFYLILQVAGLTRLAATVLGGTGLLGLVIGIAFRDIAENFLASILISMQNPFRYGDLIEVEGITGFVQRVNTRGTLLMSLDGNHIQIPNAIIYKSKILNYSSNPKVRLNFLVGVGYDVALNDAQSLAKEVILAHPAVLNEPEPIILVEKLDSATVNLRLYYWIDGSKYSQLKVNSALMRQVKAAFEDQGYSMPDDSREVVFPEGVPVRMLDSSSTPQPIPEQELKVLKKQPEQKPAVRAPVSNAEGDLSNEFDELERQTREARDPEEDSTDLLTSASAGNA